MLASAAASVVSLNRATPSQSQSTLAPMTPQQQKQQMPMIFRPFHPWHSRNQSTNTNGSRLDTPMTARTYRTYDSNWTAASPGSSHFLPSIFRPRTRPRAYTDLTERTDYTTQTDFTAATDFTNGDYETITSSQEDDFSSRSDSMSISIAQPVTVTSHGRAFARGSFRQTLRNKPSFAPPVELPDNGVGVSLSSRHSAATRNVTPRNITPGSQRQRAATTSTAEYPRHLSLDRSFVAPPHLAPTKRASYALSAWKAPSFNDDLGTLVKERGNRQILLFCLGFLCPLLWILAAVLPLPEQPVEELGVDGEKIVGMQSGEDWTWEAEKRYMKAKWWRTLNRIMSVVGVGVVAAIVSIVVKFGLECSDRDANLWVCRLRLLLLLQLERAPIITHGPPHIRHSSDIIPVYVSGDFWISTCSRSDGTNYLPNASCFFTRIPPTQTSPFSFNLSIYAI